MFGQAFNDPFSVSFKSPFELKFASSGFPDRAPGTFDTLWTRTSVPVSTDIQSRGISIIEVGTDAVITAMAGTTYSKNGGEYTASAGVISDEDTVRCKLTSSSSYSPPIRPGWYCQDCQVGAALLYIRN